MTKGAPEPPAALPNSPQWSRATKIIVVVIGLVILALLISRFRQTILLGAIAAVLAFLLSPIIGYLESRIHIRRGLLVILVYLVLAGIIVGLASLLGFASFQQITSLINQAPELLQQAVTFIGEIVGRTEPYIIGPITINPILIPWDQVQTQLLGLFEPVFSQSASFVTTLATGTVRTLTRIIFVFVLSIYLAVDQPHFDSYLLRFTEPTGYHADAVLLMQDLKRSWGAYLRGQALLGLVIFVFVWLGLSVIGVQNALALGLIAGLLEFIPNVGPIVATVIAVVVAAFQPTNYLDLPSWLFVLIIIGYMILVQQLENNLLVPRIVGGALNLKPIVVIIGVVIGAALLGVLGAVLAAPMLASFKILGTYAWRKLFDLPPFPIQRPPPEPPAIPSQPA